MDPDQTAPTGAVWCGSTLFIYEAKWTTKNIHVVIMRFKGKQLWVQCLGFSWNARTFAWLKKLINALPNYK